MVDFPASHVRDLGVVIWEPSPSDPRLHNLHRPRNRTRPFFRQKDSDDEENTDDYYTYIVYNY